MNIENMKDFEIRSLYTKAQNVLIITVIVFAATIIDFIFIVYQFFTKGAVMDTIIPLIVGAGLCVIGMVLCHIGIGYCDKALLLAEENK
jgi:cadmium resistance protein CadD (predicted permease)